MATSPSTSPKLVPDSAGFIDLSPRIETITGLPEYLKKLLPVKVNVDHSFEIQQMNLDSYEIYEMSNIAASISQQTLVSDSFKANYVGLRGFPNAQEIYRKIVLLEDIKNNPTLDYEDLKTIREITSRMKNSVDPLATQILTLQVKNQQGEIKVINKDNMNEVKDIDYSDDLKQLVTVVDSLKTKYDDTTPYMSYPLIENIPTTPGGLEVNFSKGSGLTPKEYGKIAQSASAAFVKYVEMPDPGNPEFAALISTIGTTTTVSTTSSPQ